MFLKHEFLTCVLAFLALVGFAPDASAVSEAGVDPISVSVGTDVAAERVDQFDETCDWSECRDTCYDARKACFAFGNETEACEASYDACTKWCDDNC